MPGTDRGLRIRQQSLICPICWGWCPAGAGETLFRQGLVAVVVASVLLETQWCERSVSGELPPWRPMLGARVGVHLDLGREGIACHLLVFHEGHDVINWGLKDILGLKNFTADVWVGYSIKEYISYDMVCVGDVFPTHFRKRNPLAIFLDRTSQFNIRIINSLLHS